MENKEKQNIELPENAFRELKEGEEYQPAMSPNKVYPEVSTWSVTWGLVMVVLFSAAAAYLGLKVGQVFEAAIPIAIIAIGMSSATKRKNALGENVIIQSIGACSGAVVAGGIFVMPAIYMLNLQASFFQIFIALYTTSTNPPIVNEAIAIAIKSNSFHIRSITPPRPIIAHKKTIKRASPHS